MLKLRGYHKASSPGIDDTQIPGSAITTDVNIEQVRINGLEAVLEFRPGGPLSGFANLSINHAYGYGAVTGAFLAETPPAQPFDLDHDQRLSSVVGLTFSSNDLLLSATGIYGSGLTNGVTPNAPGLRGMIRRSRPTPVLGTGLFDFNKPFKVDPNFIVNASAGYTIKAGTTHCGRRSSSTTCSTRSTCSRARSSAAHRSAAAHVQRSPDGRHVMANHSGEAGHDRPPGSPRRDVRCRRGLVVEGGIDSPVQAHRGTVARPAEDGR